MSGTSLATLATLIREQCDDLLSRWRQRVRQLPSAQGLDTPTLDDHVPTLLQELVAVLSQQSDEDIEGELCQGSPPIHGLQRLRAGFDIEEVVAEYHVLRDCLHDLAEENGIVIQGQALKMVNRLLDEAIGLAVQTYAAQRALDVQQRRAEQLAFIAHDLRTPLSAVSLAADYLGLVLDDQASDPEAAQMFQVLQRNVRQIDKLINSVIKEHADLQSQDKQPIERRVFDLWPLVQGTLHNLSPVAETASVRLINEVPHRLTVFADAELLARIFQNLLGNAIKFSPRGEVVVGAQQRSNAKHVECWVRDNGAGIAEERLDSVWDKQASDPDHEGGYGLGLAIVKELVEAHGGTVWIESAERAGTTFRFTLPAPAADQSAAQRA